MYLIIILYISIDYISFVLIKIHEITLSLLIYCIYWSFENFFRSPKTFPIYETHII